MNRSGSQEGRAMQEIRLLEAIFELVACWSKSETTNSARKLLIEYYRTCPEETAAGRARGGGSGNAGLRRCRPDRPVPTAPLPVRGAEAGGRHRD